MSRIFGFFCFLLCAVISTSEAEESDSAERAGAEGRLVSGRLSQAISAGFPYRTPEGFWEAAVVPARKTGDFLLLPKYTVEEDRMPSFDERNIYAKRKLTQLAVERYFSHFHRTVLSRYRIGHEDEAYAMMKYEADERRRAIARAERDVELYRISGDTTAMRRAKEENYRLFLRASQWGTARMAGRGD